MPNLKRENYKYMHINERNYRSIQTITNLWSIFKSMQLWKENYKSMQINDEELQLYAKYYKSMLDEL